VRPTIVIEDAVGGGRWSFDLLRDRLDCPAHAACYRGSDSGGRPVFVKAVEDGDEDGQARAEREVAAHARLGRQERVLALLGTAVTASGHAYLVFEWADLALHELLAGYAPALREVLADTVERDVGAALRAVHAAGLVHCDVAPNNIMRVEGRWKLADFDVCVPSGAPSVGQPRLRTYVSEGRDVGAPASARFDWDGLRAVVQAVRGVVADAPSLAGASGVER
jgi:serine/threonine protein kinase